MASFMSQDEIDQLLSQVDEKGEIKDTPEMAPEPVVEQIHISAGSKVYKHKEQPVQKYRYNYTSPVIKAEDIIYNPSTGLFDEPQKKAVYSLKLYSKKH